MRTQQPLEATTSRVLLAVRLATFCKETLTLEVHLTCRAVEAFRVPVLIECLDPTVARLNGELTSITLSLEHHCPVFGTVYLAIFIVKTASAYWLVALAAEKTAHVKGVLHCIHHFSYNGTPTVAAVRSKVQLIVLLTEQLAFLLHKPTVHQWRTAVRIGTDEVVRTPGLIQRRYKWTSYSCSTCIA